MSVTFLAMILILCVLLIVLLGFVTLNRYISYKERVALAQLGFSIEDLSRDAAAKRHGNRGVLWGGVITTMSGLALLLGLATLGIGAWLLAGLLPLFVGLGMVLIYFMTLGPAPDEKRAQSAEVQNPEGSTGTNADGITPFAADGAGGASQGKPEQDQGSQGC